MIDVYLVASDGPALQAFCSAFANVIGPLPGRAARAEEILEDGTQIEAIPAAGDPAKIYACIRAGQAVAIPAGIEACDEAEGAAVCGVWA